ncbi:MAG: GNAT family N-acetyltransferase [Clostridia bacterium]|nr:GNAT family N-acetyltransferase [Clostridia bacterium]
MALWVTHLMVADRVLKVLGHLDARGFCVGSIAPDCNQENADWTDFTPPREVTHWMNGKIKDEDDCDRFRDVYFLSRENEIETDEEYAFLLGYYAHLITDAMYIKFLTDESRTGNVWKRIMADDETKKRAEGLECTWKNIRTILPKEVRFSEIGAIERKYLDTHPDSGFLKHIMTLTDFPDYIDYLPKGAVRRKVGVMGVIPEPLKDGQRFIGVTEEEMIGFCDCAANTVIQKIRAAETAFGKDKEFEFLDTAFLKSEEIFLRLVKTSPAKPEMRFLPAYKFEICLPDGTRAGECDLRIGHNDKTYLGGNIGYLVDAPHRGHHYAAKAVLLLKALARKHNMAHIFITCVPDNIASEKSILYAGGEYIETRDLPEDNDMYLEGKRAVKIFRIRL